MVGKSRPALPNLARMAQQYHGVLATSATVESLFSVVDFAFADRRKSQSAETLLANLAFAKRNLPSITAEAHKYMTLALRYPAFACHSTGYEACTVTVIDAGGGSVLRRPHSV